MLCLGLIKDPPPDTHPVRLPLPHLPFSELQNLAGECPPPPGMTFLAPLLQSPETSLESAFNKSCLAPTSSGVFTSPAKLYRYEEQSIRRKTGKLLFIKIKNFAL